jgi:thymidine kinase
MFAGKTTELTRRLRRATAAGKKILLLKSASDERYVDGRAIVVTHDGEETRARSVERLEDANNLAWSYDVIGIDEGQVRKGSMLCRSALSIFQP